MLPYQDDFLLFLQTNGYSSKTVYNYERDLDVLNSFLEQCKIQFTMLDKRTIMLYKAYLVSNDRQTASTEKPASTPLGSRSINRMLSSVRSYLKYLVDMDHGCPVSPNAVKLVRTEKKHPQVAELDDLTRLIESPTDFEPDTTVALRNRAILEILFATGMRISELCSLNRSQIDGSGRVFITGKGRKQRFVYLTPRAAKHLDDYLSTRKDNCPALFVPYGGRNISNPRRRLSANYIQERIKRYREKLRINIPTSAHSLRHGFATYLAEKGANPAAIQILLGHESLNTTTRYVHASDRFAEETHQRFHPLKSD
jgi:site-specific recombinase XerD